MKDRTYDSVFLDVKLAKQQSSTSDGDPALALASIGLWFVLAF
jgi:hypothetical protein